LTFWNETDAGLDMTNFKGYFKDTLNIPSCLTLMAVIALAKYFVLGLEDLFGSLDVPRISHRS
jgi:hypothetical protein